MAKKVLLPNLTPSQDRVGQDTTLAVNVFFLESDPWVSLGTHQPHVILPKEAVVRRTMAP